MRINMDSKILSAQGAILIYKVSVGTLKHARRTITESRILFLRSNVTYYRIHSNGAALSSF